MKKSTLTPDWNQEVQLTHCYPSLSQSILVQILVNEYMSWKVISEIELYMNEIAYGGGYIACHKPNIF